MEALLLYFGKVIFTSAVLFLYYRLLLKDKTFHHYNRFYLLVAVLTSLLLPLLKVSYFTIEINNDIYLIYNQLQQFKSSEVSADEISFIKVISVVIGLFSLFFLAKFMLGLFQIQRLKKKFKKENVQGISFYRTDLEQAPFSFFRSLFWKNSIEIQSDLGRQILKHEMVHIEQRHSWDKIFIELTTALFWFNPLFYLYKKEINLIHEYLADKKAIKNSDTKAFAQMLLASHFSGKQFQATSPFISSNLKKRLTMLKSSKTKYSYARRILALPLLFALALIYMVNAENKKIEVANLEIEGYISQMETDTIPPSPPAVPAHADVPAPNNPPIVPAVPAVPTMKSKELKAESYINIKKKGEARKLSLQLKKNSDELAALADKKEFNSARFKELESNMAVLNRKMKKINEEDHFRNALEKLKADQSKLEIVDTPNFTNKIKMAEKKAQEAENLISSREFQQRIKNAEIAAEEAVQKSNAVNLMKDASGSTVVIFIDGKSATHEEMNKVPPHTIESVRVFKEGFAGKKTGEIHITLKK